MFAVKESITAASAKKLAGNAMELKKINEMNCLFEAIEERASKGFFEYTTPILHNDVVAVKKLLEDLGYSVFSIQNVVTMNWE